jgi:two-component system cell cycle sensor histidine kinase/response regulator CckA
MAVTPSTILLVDDDAMNRHVFAALFQGAGYRVLEAETGLDALELARRHRPDLIVLDVSLPDVSGFEVCERLRAEPATKSLSILHLSAVFVGPEDRTHGLESGADAYLTKPVEPREVLATARALLRTHAAEEAARRAAQQWRTTFDAISDPLCLLDADGRLCRCNRALTELLGLGFGRLVGRPLADVAADSLSAEEAGALVAAAREVGREGRELTLAGRCFHVTGDLIRDDPDSDLNAGKVVILGDVTQRKHLEEQLRQSQRLEAVGRLAGGVAQDFNNLLTAILGNASLLLRDLPAGDPDRALVGTIERAAWRAADLTRQLLGFSRQALLWLQTVDPGKLLDDVTPSVAPQRPPGVTLTLDRAPGLWPVRADPAQLAQVLTNLCLNGLEAMSGAGTLALRASNETLTAEQIGQDLEARPGEFVRFVVEDSGPGIPAEVLDKIFDPFFTTKPVGRGSGLGLAMVYGIVKQHHGWVSCHSEAGRGTRFELYLPRAEPDVCEPAAPRLVLLADDNDVLRALAAAYLRQGGYEVLQAADGRQAVELFEREQGRVDLVILARALTHQPGAEALRRMRAVKPSVRGLLAGDPQAGETSDEAGVVARPYREGDLLEAVRRALL